MFFAKLSSKISYKLLLSSAALSFCACNNFGVQTSEKTLPRVTFLLQNETSNPVSGERAKEVLDAIKNYTQTDVKFTFIYNDDYEDTINSVLDNPSELPMIMSIKTLNSNVADAVKNGAFWDLNYFIWDEEKYPNLSKANKKICKSLTIDSHLIGIYKARDIGRYGFAYRTDWAEKLGLDEPKTIEDVYNMLYAFTYNDPDGDGKKNTYGLALSKYTGPFDIIQTWFGCGNGWTEMSSSLVPVHQTQEYLTALDWLRKIYAEGLIAPDWTAKSTSTWKNQVIDGQAGVFVDVMDSSRRIWEQFQTKNIRSVVDPKKYAEMTLVGPINNRTQATDGYNGFIAITHAARTKEQVENCLHFLDKMNDDEMLILASYGLKDYNYRIDNDGYLIDIDTANVEISRVYNGLNQVLTYIPHMLKDARPVVRMTEKAQVEQKVIALNEKVAVLNPASAYLASSKTYKKNKLSLDSIIEEARTQYICGEINRDLLSEAHNKWYEMGGKDIITEVNTLYKSHK